MSPAAAATFHRHPEADGGGVGARGRQQNRCEMSYIPFSSHCQSSPFALQEEFSTVTQKLTEAVSAQEGDDNIVLAFKKDYLDDFTVYRLWAVVYSEVFYSKLVFRKRATTTHCAGFQGRLSGQLHGIEAILSCFLHTVWRFDSIASGNVGQLRVRQMLTDPFGVTWCRCMAMAVSFLVRILNVGSWKLTTNGIMLYGAETPTWWFALACASTLCGLRVCGK